MSQILLPPPAPSQPGSAPGAPLATVPPPQSRPYEPEPPKKPSAFWRAVKWPIRQILKAIYLTGRAAKRHRVVAALLLLALVGLGVGTFEVYQVTHPTAGNVPRQSAQSPLAGGADTPFTITSAAQPPLSPAVIHFLHAWKTYDFQELQGSLGSQVTLDSPELNIQQGATASDLQDRFDRIKAGDYAFQQFIYSGGYLSPAGTANFTVQVVVSKQGSQGVAILTWYFLVGPDGQIAAWHDLTPTA